MRVVIEILDNPQGVNLKKLLASIKQKFLDLGLFVSVRVEE